MHNLQPEHLFEGIEIVIAMQQFVLCLQTESGDQAVDGLADGFVAAQIVNSRGRVGPSLRARPARDWLTSPPQRTFPRRRRMEP
jgi:hypothetical protein